MNDDITLNYPDSFKICCSQNKKKVKDYPGVETQVNSALGHINVTTLVRGHPLRFRATILDERACGGNQG